jgi:hypothetical protein
MMNKEDDGNSKQSEGPAKVFNCKLTTGWKPPHRHSKIGDISRDVYDGVQ